MGTIEEFLLSNGWAGIVILGLLWFIREERTEKKELRSQLDTLRDQLIRQRDETIRDLINRGGLIHGGSNG
jgi:hypothetical protein